MRICAIGDPHGDIDKMKGIPLYDVDAILVTGDISNANIIRKMHFSNIERQMNGQEPIKYARAEKKKAFMESYKSGMAVMKYLTKYAPVYTIFGNVESDNKETRQKIEEIGSELPFIRNDIQEMRNATVLNNRIARIGNIRVGALRYFIDKEWVSEFATYEIEERTLIAQKDTEKAKRVLEWFAKVDILLCHQPPYGVLDQVNYSGAPKEWQGKHAGSRTILQYIKKYKPRYVFCGHIHEGRGRAMIGKTEVHNLGNGGHAIVEL
jgi:Icc-related predicted phosphoesterase